jgi:hypothetical protein
MARFWRIAARVRGRPIMAEPGIELRENENTAYEKSDWPIGRIGLVFLGTFVMLVVVPFVLMWAFPDSIPDQRRSLTIVPPAPRQQVAPSVDLAQYVAAQKLKLNTYYWIDRDRGIVHIPIEEAMKRVAAHGIPGFPDAPR